MQSVPPLGNHGLISHYYRTTLEDMGGAKGAQEAFPGLKELTSCEKRSHLSLDFCKPDTMTHGLCT